MVRICGFLTGQTYFIVLEKYCGFPSVNVSRGLSNVFIEKLDASAMQEYILDYCSYSGLVLRFTCSIKLNKIVLS